jgi:hypothetical protein
MMGGIFWQRWSPALCWSAVAQKQGGILKVYHRDSPDVVCTWDLLLGKGQEKLRTHPRKIWYHNVDSVMANGDCEDAGRLPQDREMLWGGRRGNGNFVASRTDGVP